jgi:hypothetical protein
MCWSEQLGGPSIDLLSNWIIIIWAVGGPCRWLSEQLGARAVDYLSSWGPVPLNIWAVGGPCHWLSEQLGALCRWLSEQLEGPCRWISEQLGARAVEFLSSWGPMPLNFWAVDGPCRLISEQLGGPCRWLSEQSWGPISGAGSKTMTRHLTEKLAHRPRMMIILIPPGCYGWP